MKTRSQARSDDTIEDDTLSTYTEDPDSLTEDEDGSIVGDIALCHECGKHSESLSNHKGGLWCVECINIDKKNDGDTQEPKDRPLRWLVWTLLLILVPVCIAWFKADLITNITASESKSALNCSDLRAEIKQLKLNFGTQESDTWHNFHSGISHVLPGPDPVGSTTFLLLHEAKARQTADQIAREVGRLAASCLDGELLHLNGTSMADRSLHKLFLQNYQKKVEESRVMYVSEFHRLPSEVAREFHFFCDSYTPLVPQSVFILLLQVERLPSGDDVTASAETELKRIWAHEMQSNIIQPLITRITANVVRIFE